MLWYDEVGIDDVDLVGGKNASLGEMIQELTPRGVRVPNGFATTSRAYKVFIEEAGEVHVAPAPGRPAPIPPTCPLAPPATPHVRSPAGIQKELEAIFAGLDHTNVDDLREAGAAARALVLHTPFPARLEEEIAAAYLELCEEVAGPQELLTTSHGRSISLAAVDVAVRSSATAEDLPDASFAGQQETYLNVRGVRAVLQHVHQCFASLFTDRAISYRCNMGFDHFQVQLSCGVQRMVRSDLSSSGVMFTIDTETGFQDAVLITSAYGLGENVVQGAVSPDEFLLFKPTLAQGKEPILSKRLGSKEVRMVYAEGGTKLTVNRATAELERSTFSITDAEALELGKWAVVIEEHYSAKRGRHMPMDIEWAKDGVTGDLFIVQARPETVQSNRRQDVLREFRMRPTTLPLTPVTRGRAVGAMIGAGRAKVLGDTAAASPPRRPAPPPPAMARFRCPPRPEGAAPRGRGRRAPQRPCPTVPSAPPSRPPQTRSPP